MKLRIVVLLAALSTMAWRADAVEAAGTMTILDGDALVYRGSGRVMAVEGLPVARGDIIETSEKGFAQIELAERVVAQMGPATRLQISASVGTRKPDTTLYALEGWLKLDGSKSAAGADSQPELRTPLGDVAVGTAVVVIKLTRAEMSLFVERGELRVAERTNGVAAAPMALKTGSFYVRKAAMRGVIGKAATPAFVSEVPRPFKDSLPSRLERFRNQQVQPHEATDFVYADVERWLKAEPAVRRPLMQRWRGKARDGAFRSSLIANLSAFPEWDPILFPEKYKPKEPPRPVVKAPSPIVRPAPAPAAVATHPASAAEQ